MHELTKPAKLVQGNNRVWTKIETHGGASVDMQVSSYGRDTQSNQMIQNDLRFRDLDQRLLPRAFSALGDFGAIEETESSSLRSHLSKTSSQFPRTKFHVRESPRRYSTSSWPTEKPFTNRVPQVTSREFSARNNNRRRQSEGFLISGAKTFGLVGYRNGNDSIDISSGQRTENLSLNTKQAKRGENDNYSNKIVHNINLASVDMMTSVVAATFEQPKKYYSLPSRRYSLPVNDMTNDFNSRNVPQQRNSLPTEECLREYNFDSDTELQWQRLVARAKTLQFATTMRPEIVHTRFEEKNEKEMTQKTTESKRTFDKGVDSKDGRNGEDVTCNAKKENNNINNNNHHQSIVRRRRRTEERRYSLRKIPTVIESSSESQTKNDSGDDSEQKKENTSSEGQNTLVREQRCFIRTTGDDNTNRRHSVAIVRTTPELKERISGYSTHGALEYAKTLMGKIQEEGKTKSKKERLDDMSKVLKLVLEELNRIELPDRDLVSLFISLRAKMVNLRAELKADEGETNSESGEVKPEENKVLSKSLPRPTRGGQGEKTPSHPRRFSWI